MRVLLSARGTSFIAPRCTRSLSKTLAHHRQHKEHDAIIEQDHAETLIEQDEAKTPSSLPENELPTTTHQLRVSDEFVTSDSPTLTYKNLLEYKPNGQDQYGFKNILTTLKHYFLGDDHHTHSVFTGAHLSKSKYAKRIEQRTFEDLKFIRVVSGKGGNGAVSFFRDANRPVGPPDGGDGGDGGNVYIRVVDTKSSLHKVQRSYQAKSGQSGMGSQLDGKNGEDVIIEVPVGTTIRWIPDPLEIRPLLKKSTSSGDLEKINMELKVIQSDYGNETMALQFFRNGFKPGDGWIFKERDEEYQRQRDYFNELNENVKVYDQELIDEEIMQDHFPLLGYDLDKPSIEPLLLVKGGKGGMGNMHFLTKDVRNPRFSKSGRPGITQFFLLELKLIADLGLVGLPNAGKSTLLRAISKARPRVGHWEFTTLQPTIGTISRSIDKDPFTVADIPGIIAGASQNKGMGLDFLRHIERCQGLVFVVSLESEKPVADLQTLMHEVGDKRMDGKQKLVIATKADLNESSERYVQLKQFIESQQPADGIAWKVLPVCALHNENVEHCVKLMSETASK